MVCLLSRFSSCYWTGYSSRLNPGERSASRPFAQFVWSSSAAAAWCFLVTLPLRTRLPVGWITPALVLCSFSPSLPPSHTSQATFFGGEAFALAFAQCAPLTLLQQVAAAADPVKIRSSLPAFVCSQAQEAPRKATCSRGS